MNIRVYAKAMCVCAATVGVAACATASREPRWAANGWLTPGMTGEPEVIGVYARRAECESAVNEWMSRQVVGNPIHGECLPIDPH
ncbi:MAG: hypothetical protein GC153_04370 [Alphaproteobacteria bacterium]|nr:hypothetical protein [Alphaproteobacteria bacterium]